VVAVR
jgi:hypothetical protein